MNETNQQRIDDFLSSLETALGRRGAQSKAILHEVKTDLNDHVERFAAGGRAGDEAVTKALEEMGNPYELAHHMRRETPPFNGNLARGIRYAAAGAVTVWLLWLMWLSRGGTYGLSGFAVLVGVLLLHLPVILLLWPRIVWRRNWLFGLIPAGLAFLAALVFAAGSVESPPVILTLTENGVAESPQPGDLVAANHDPGTARILVFGAAGVPVIVLLIAIQRRVQRRIVLLAAGLALLLFEGSFQVEELLFRQDREQVRAYLQSSLKESGAYPTIEDLKTNGPKIRGRSRVSAADETFSLFWSRPLCPGHAIHYTSVDDRIRVQG